MNRSVWIGLEFFVLRWIGVVRHCLPHDYQSVSFMRWYGNAVSLGCMVMNILPRIAEINIPTTDFAESNIGILCLFQIRPALGALKCEFNFAVGNGCHS